ncbi:hypothetical protein JKP88DRAFT_296872 [Tribonema minus]|uniref:FG-GAP repeat-containing protein n=1 Tax=Tribonema minus TaxID=303371 RepID=A0A836CMR8_9STRA|nr:hypothetical protein JKP88DRAFT_296872 [Tribonema minus]
MRTRDGLVILVAFGATLTSLRSGGDVTLTEIWRLDSPVHHRHHLQEQPGDYHVHAAPAPIIADVDGDGLNEVVHVDGSGWLQVLRSPSGGAPLEVISRVHCAPKALLSEQGELPVALAAGYLTPGAADMHIVVVREDWMVLCYASDLRLVWRRELRHADAAAAAARFGGGGDGGVSGGGGGGGGGGSGSDPLADYVIDQVAVTLTPSPKAGGGRGLVVVGGTMRPRRAAAGGGGGVIVEADFADSDGSAAAIDAAERAREAAAHFSLYAFDGATGAERWRHLGVRAEGEGQGGGASGEGGEGAGAGKGGAPALRPQYKVSDADLHRDEREAFGGWRAYEASLLLRALPHRWAAPHDTRIAAAHLVRRRIAPPAAAAPGAAAAAGGASFLSKLAAPRGGASQRQQRQRKAAAAAAAAQPPPNVVLTHTAHGVEAVALDTGRPVCALPLAAPRGQAAAFADVNGDGVIDRVGAAEGVAAAAAARHSTHHHRHRRHNLASDVAALRRGCTAVALSGVPPATPLFNGTICADAAAVPSARAAAAAFTRGAERVVAAPALPLLVPRAAPAAAAAAAAAGKHAAPPPRAPMDTVFAMSEGTVSSYAPDGRLNWQARNGPRWRAGDDGDGGSATPPGTGGYLALLPLARGFIGGGGGGAAAGDVGIVVAGEAEVVVYAARTGRVLGRAALPEPPALPPVVGDLDNDGAADVLLVGGDWALALRARREVAARLLLALLALVAAATVAVAAAAQQRGDGVGSVGGGRRPIKRATD